MNYLNANNNNETMYMTYEDYENLKDKMNSHRRKRIKIDRQNRTRYYTKQRIMGAGIMLIGIIALIVGCGIDTPLLEYFGAFVGAVGLYTIMTPKMILVDWYYLQRQDKINEY